MNQFAKEILYESQFGNEIESRNGLSEKLHDISFMIIHWTIYFSSEISSLQYLYSIESYDTEMGEMNV